VGCFAEGLELSYERGTFGTDVAKEATKQVTLEPFVLNNIKEGKTLNFLEKLGMTTGLGSFPTMGGFFMANVSINETSIGKGAELAARIGESIAAQLTANKDAIIAELVGKVGN
jgi:hypothetical protein